MKNKKITKIDLFLELAKPDEFGKSRWVYSREFIGKYQSLQLGNGGAGSRKSSILAKKYIIEFDKNITSGNSIDKIRLNGFNKKFNFKNTIRQDIKDFYKNKNCVMLGINGKSENTYIEIDHKDGRKCDENVSNIANQKIEDFQPLCKATNDIKRQICKKCKETGIRWDAKNILGNPFSFYDGDENYNEVLGCRGCYQYDPVEYRRKSIKRIIEVFANKLIKKFTKDNF